MRVISFNVLDGFETRPERKPAVFNWLAEMQPDVLALQEMNTYTPERLAADALRWGHAHSLLLKLEGYSTALTSRFPLELRARVLEGFKHGLLHAATAELDFFVVHLSPFRREERLHEADAVLARVNAVRGAGRRVMVLGDFNALSPEDADYYATHSGVREFMRFGDAEFGWSNTLRGELDFAVLEKFKAAGLLDLVAQQTPDPRARLSYPTPLLEPDARSEAHARRSMRLDYILSSAELAAECRSASIVRTALTEQLSDHYPVVADLSI